MSIQKKYWIGGIYFYFILIFQLGAQDYRLKTNTISVDDGLSNRNIYSWHQCQRGFIWLGTNNGLNRYDGLNIKVYKAPEYPFVSNRIMRMVEDHRGDFWLMHPKNAYGVENAKAIGILNPYSEAYTLLNEYVDDLPFEVDQIIDMRSLDNEPVCIFLSDGKIYRYGVDGLTLYKQVENKEMTFHLWQSWLDEYTTSATVRAHQFWPNYFQEDVFQHISDTHNFSDLYKQKFFLTTSFQPFNIYLFQNLAGDSLAFVDQEGQKVPTYHEKLSFKDIHFTALDNQGNTWVVLEDGTIYINKLIQNKFSQSIITDYQVRGIQKYDSFPLVFNDLYYTQSRSNKFTNHFKRYGEPFPLYQEEDQLWIGTLVGKIMQFNTAKEVLSDISECYSDRNKGICWSIFRDRTGRLWQGHHRGLYYLDEAENCIKPLVPSAAFSALSEQAIHAFHENEKGIWLASSHGIYRMNKNYQVVERWHRGAKQQEKRLPFNHILHFHEDEQGVFWLASKGNGLIKWDPETGIYEEFTTKKGMPHNTLYAVYEDDYGYLWMSSDYGIIRFNKANNEIQVFTEKDGLLHNEFNATSHFQATDGTLYFGGLKGITIFHPKDFLTAPEHIPALCINSLEIENKDATSRNVLPQILKGETLTIQPSDLGFSVKFSLLEFLQPKKVIYSYKIEGIDSDWTVIKDPTIKVRKLPYRKYTLLLKAQTSSGIWTESIKIPIHFVKPLYLETWFIVTGIVIMMVLLFLGLRLRTRNLKRAKRKLEEIIEERTAKIESDKALITQQAQDLKKLDEAKSRFFANVSHELRTPLTLIAGPITQLLHEDATISKDDLDPQLSLILNNTDKLKSLVDDILNLSKLSANRLPVEAQDISVIVFVSRIVQNFSTLAQKLQIQYILNTEHVAQEWIRVDSGKVEKVIANLVSNALKFTQAQGKVTVAVSTTIEELTVQVADTGKGIDVAHLDRLFDRFYQVGQTEDTFQSGTGIGLSLAKELAVLLGGDIQVESILGHGSVFTFKVPIVPAKASEDVLEEDEDVLIEEAFILQSPVNSTDVNTILIVEDNLEMQQFLRQLLQKEYRIFQAYHGKEALEILANESIHLVISDLMMPEMDGFELLKQVRKSDAWSSLPFIMLTALDDDDSKLTALTLGVDDYLAKPFLPPELFARVRNLIDRYWIRQQVIKEENIDLEELPASIHLASAISGQELEWIEQVKAIILAELENKTFRLEDVAAQMSLGMRQFYRKVKKITGLSPKEYHREVALQEARKMLESKKYTTVKAVAQSVGFSQNASRFSQYYLKRFGKKPSEYLNL